MPTTDASKQNNTGSLSGPVIIQNGGFMQWRSASGVYLNVNRHKLECIALVCAWGCLFVCLFVCVMNVACCHQRWMMRRALDWLSSHQHACPWSHSIVVTGLHAVPTATDATHSVRLFVCLSVCLSHACAEAVPIDMLLVGRKKPCMVWGWDPHRAILGVVWHMKKHWKCLLWYTQQKR